MTLGARKIDSFLLLLWLYLCATGGCFLFFFFYVCATTTTKYKNSSPPHFFFLSFLSCGTHSKCWGYPQGNNIKKLCLLRLPLDRQFARKKMSHKRDWTPVSWENLIIFLSLSLRTTSLRRFKNNQRFVYQIKNKFSLIFFFFSRFPFSLPQLGT